LIVTFIFKIFFQAGPSRRSAIGLLTASHSSPQPPHHQLLAQMFCQPIAAMSAGRAAKSFRRDLIQPHTLPDFDFKTDSSNVALDADCVKQHSRLWPFNPLTWRFHALSCLGLMRQF
jgi:hypothetical protein